MLTLPAVAEAPYFCAAAPGRLPKKVVPLDYSIDIVPDTKSQTPTGSESVTLLFGSATSSVIFNSLNETGLPFNRGKPVKTVVETDARP